MNGFAKEKVTGSLEEQGNLALVDRALCDPLVAPYIEFISRQICANVDNKSIKYIVVNNPVAEAMFDFARKIATVAMTLDIAAPDFTNEEWKTTFTDTCERALLSRSEYQPLSDSCKQSIQSKFSLLQLAKLGMFMETGYSFATIVLASRVVQVTAMIKQGNYPHLLRLSNKEIAVDQNALAARAEKNGVDASYVVPLSTNKTQTE